MLGNEEKRTIYDVYGKEGLEAGMEVGERLRDPTELKREFERFKAKQVPTLTLPAYIPKTKGLQSLKLSPCVQAEERQEASVAHRGMYIFKVDACDLMNPYDTDVDHTPELISVATTNSVQIPVSETFAASVGCTPSVHISHASRLSNLCFGPPMGSPTMLDLAEDVRS